MKHEMRKYIDTFKQKLTESENLNITNDMFSFSDMIGFTRWILQGDDFGNITRYIYIETKDDFIDDHLVEDKHKLGWIAQEVETVIPKAVITTKNEKYEIDDFKSLNSDQIIACLYGAVQKLIEKNEKLEEFISRLDIEEE